MVRASWPCRRKAPLTKQLTMPITAKKKLPRPRMLWYLTQSLGVGAKSCATTLKNHIAAIKVTAPAITDAIATIRYFGAKTAKNKTPTKSNHRKTLPCFFWLFKGYFLFIFIKVLTNLLERCAFWLQISRAQL